ncbi:MAG: tetratricopeptide repeat protein [Spirochaetales bacterium]|nr:tetratricopeptide repeat protein [Spirochaetales bacterium]
MAVADPDPKQQDLSPLSLKVYSSTASPLGNDNTIFSTGASASLAISYLLNPDALVQPFGSASYTLLPLELISSISIIDVALGTDVRIADIGKLVFTASAQAGLFFAGFNNNQLADRSVAPFFDMFLNLFTINTFKIRPSWSGIIGAGFGIQYDVSSRFGLKLAVSYRHLFGLYNELSVGIGTSHRFLRKKTDLEQMMEIRPEQLTKLSLDSFQYEPIFPVLFKYYASNSLGHCVFTNDEEFDISDLSITMYVSQYMANPTTCQTEPDVGAGESVDVEIYALFTDEVLNLTEKTVVSVEFTVSGTADGRQFENQFTESIDLFDRNTITWAEDQRAAAFVTLKDPTVLKFAKTTSGIIRDSTYNALNNNLQLAIALHEAITFYGIRYVIDPASSYAELSGAGSAFDYLQFPKQTIDYKAGDCDDLSILYASLLQAVGIETAFITIPGHIYIAFSTGVPDWQAVKQFRYHEDLIIRDGKVWLPVEVTSIGDGFMKAWQIGAKEWRENESEAGFIPMSEAWSTYAPVGIASQADTLDSLDSQTLINAFNSEIEIFINREIYDTVDALRERIASSNNNPKLMNRLAVVYASYGLYDQARAELEKILESTEYVPAIINAGNIAFLQGDFDSALHLFRRSDDIQPNNPGVVLGLCRTNHELENYGSAKKEYEKLKTLDPDLAERYSYIVLSADEATRASDESHTRKWVEWEIK